MASICPSGVEKGLGGSVCSAGVSRALLADSYLPPDAMGTGPSHLGLLVAEPDLQWLGAMKTCPSILGPKCAGAATKKLRARGGQQQVRLPLISRILATSSFLPNQISSATFLTGSVSPNTSR